MAGIRERKVAATRQRISDEATRLFERFGFEEVSLARVAEAADVSLKTVVNHFGAKEDLFFDAEPAIVSALVDTATNRGDDTATRALRPLILDGPILAGPTSWRGVDAADWRSMRTWSECEANSPTLTTRRAAILQSWVEPLTRASGSAAWAAMLVGLLGLRHTLVQQALLDGLTPTVTEGLVRTELGAGLDLLDTMLESARLSGAKLDH